MTAAPECISEAEIIRMLNSALEENYYSDLIDWPDSDIAIDLCNYAPGLEDIEPENDDLLAGIAAWRKQLKPKEA